MESRKNIKPLNGIGPAVGKSPRDLLRERAKSRPIPARIVRIFDYPAAFTTLPEYSARNGQRVSVVRQLTQEEADQGEGMEPMYLIRAEDGWEGRAWASELKPLGE